MRDASFVPSATLTEILRHPPPWAGLVLWISVIILAFARGEAPERCAAAILTMDLLIMTFFPDPPSRNIMHWRLLASDVAVLAALGWITFTSARAWTLWALAFQVLAVVAHGPRLFYGGIWNSSYGGLINLSGYLVMAALLAGTLMEAHRHDRR